MQNKACFTITILLIFITTNVMSVKQNGQTYFPNTLNSFWVYEDQDGKELIRRVTESKIHDGRTYAGFKYEPELKESKDYTQFVYPMYCHYGEDWVSFHVGEKVKKAIKTRLTNEMELFSKLSISSLKKNFPPNSNITAALDYDIEVNAQSLLKLLPMQVEIDKQWKAIEINAKISMKFNIEGLKIFQDAEDFPTTILNFAIVQKGKILGTESVETEAGTFDECLKIVYKTDTKMTETHPIAPADLPGESVTTLWFAPHVGIVKLQSETEMIFLHALSERELVKKHASNEEVAAITKPTVKTFQLKKYKIVPDMDQSKQSK